jgi:hypothetical protein
MLLLLFAGGGLPVPGDPSKQRGHGSVARIAHSLHRLPSGDVALLERSTQRLSAGDVREIRKEIRRL